MKGKLPTTILRIIAILSAIGGVLVCVFMLPTFGASIAQNYLAYAFWQYPIIIGLFVAAACFFFAVFQFWLLLNSLDRDGMFSIKNLKAIRVSSIIFSILYFLFAMPIIYLAANAEDAPGLILIGVSLDLFSIGVAAVAAILEQIGNNYNR